MFYFFCASQALSVNTIKYSASVRYVWMEISLDNRRYLEGMANLISCYSNLQTLVIEFVVRYVFIYTIIVNEVNSTFSAVFNLPYVFSENLTAPRGVLRRNS